MNRPGISVNQGMRIVKALLVSYLLTAGLLLLLAGLLYRFRLDEGKVQIGIIVIYIVSCFAGGFLEGKIMKNRKFLWGALLGLLYFLVMTLVSLAVNRTLQDGAANCLTTLILCLCGGTLGGMCA